MLSFTHHLRLQERKKRCSVCRVDSRAYRQRTQTARVGREHVTVTKSYSSSSLPPPREKHTKKIKTIKYMTFDSAQGAAPLTSEGGEVLLLSSSCLPLVFLHTCVHSLSTEWSAYCPRTCCCACKSVWQIIFMASYPPAVCAPCWLQYCGWETVVLTSSHPTPRVLHTRECVCARVCVFVCVYVCAWMYLVLSLSSRCAVKYRNFYIEDTERSVTFIYLTSRSFFVSYQLSCLFVFSPILLLLFL